MITHHCDVLHCEHDSICSLLGLELCSGCAEGTLTALQDLVRYGALGEELEDCLWI